MFDKYFTQDINLNWDYIMSIPEFAILEKCEQNPKWHGEGNALNHTKKCVEWAMKYPFMSWETLDYKRLMIMCVLFHDIGKSVTTVFKNGNWHSYGHEIAGERIARRILWDEPIELRETICYCVRYHMEPLNIMEKNNNKFTSIGKIALECTPFLTDTALIFTKTADINGSIPEDNRITEENNIEIEEFARIFYGMGNIFGIGTELNKRCNRRILYDIKSTVTNSEKMQTITVMVGLPGAGKDTWITNHLGPNTQVVSRDAIREELGFTKAGEKAVLTSEKEDKVTEVFNSRLCKYLDEGYNVIVNNINLKKVYREALKAVVGNRPVLWRCVYIEAPSLSDNIKRREGQIPAKNFEEMVERLDFPRYDEFDVIQIEKQTIATETFR